MNGWKTLTGGGLMIAWGIGGLLLGTHEVDKAVQLVSEGVAVIGIGHKIEKQTQQLKPPPS